MAPHFHRQAIVQLRESFSTTKFLEMHLAVRTGQGGIEQPESIQPWLDQPGPMQNAQRVPLRKKTNDDTFTFFPGVDLHE